jgi:ribosomal protein L37AE/L43A
MDLTTLTAGLSAAKQVKEFVSELTKSKSEHTNQLLLNNAAQSVGEVLEALYSVQTELFQLVDENRSLNDSLRTYTDWEAIAVDYKLVETSGSAMVYQYAGMDQPNHYLCPTCFENRNKHILQDRRLISGGWDCKSCGSIFFVGERAPSKSITRRSSGWMST